MKKLLTLCLALAMTLSVGAYALTTLGSPTAKAADETATVTSDTLTVKASEAYAYATDTPETHYDLVTSVANADITTVQNNCGMTLLSQKLTEAPNVKFTLATAVNADSYEYVTFKALYWANGSNYLDTTFSNLAGDKSATAAVYGIQSKSVSSNALWVTLRTADIKNAEGKVDGFIMTAPTFTADMYMACFFISDFTFTNSAVTSLKIDYANSTPLEQDKFSKIQIWMDNGLRNRISNVSGTLKATVKFANPLPVDFVDYYSLKALIWGGNRSGLPFKVYALGGDKVNQTAYVFNYASTADPESYEGNLDMRIAAKAENAAENQKFALDTGAYTLKMDDSVTMDVSYAHGAYLYNKRDTSGNIRLKFKTVSYSSAVTSAVYNGLVRGSSKDIAYAYVPMAANHWYVFGDGRNTVKGDIYSVDEYTDIIYDVTAHAFSVKIGEATPVMAKMFQSADASVTDAAGTGRIAWDANNAEAIIKATLTDFSITDADGYNLGVAMSRTQDARMTYTYEENFYGYAGKTVTVKYIGDGDGGSPLVYGSDGTRLTIPVTSLGKGEYSFVMPDADVKLVMKRRIENSEIYGTYANAESGDYFVLGEQSYKSINGVKTNIDLAVYTGGIVDVIDGENTTEGEYTIGKLVVGNTVYKKLLKYSVAFVVDGKTVKSETLSSGDYFATAPENPTKDGYVFAGWRTSGGEAYEADKTITESTTFYAVFEEEGGHTDPKAESKSGCGGNIAYSCFAFIPLAAIIFGIKNKREGGR